MFGGSFSIVKLIVIVSIIVIIIAFLEIFISKKMNQCVYQLPKYYMKIKLKNIDKPLYLYNCNNCSSGEICECKEWNINGYDKIIVNEHCSNILDRSIKKLSTSFKNIFNSGTPVNDILYSVAGANKTVNITNPINMSEDAKTKWKLLYPKGAKINCFIADNKIYFM